MDTNSRYGTADHIDQVASLYVADSESRRTGTRSVASNTPASQVDFGSGWYHEAAVADAKEAHAHPYR